MTRIRTIFCAATLLFSFCASAQEIQIEANGGLQGLHYSIPNGARKLQGAGGLSINYSYPLAKRWNLLAGVSGGYYSTQATLKDGAVFSSNETDEKGSAFRLDASTTGYTETQRFFAAGIPVLLQYHTQGQTQWYVNAGAKFLCPFTSTVKASASQITLSGYYPDYNIEVKDLPQHGFGTVDNWQGKAKQNLNATVALSAATGMRFSIAQNIRLYTGLYADYGLTNMQTDDGSGNFFAGYNAKNINGVRAAGVAKMADKTRILAYGIHISVQFARRN